MVDEAASATSPLTIPPASTSRTTLVGPDPEGAGTRGPISRQAPAVSPKMPTTPFDVHVLPTNGPRMASTATAVSLPTPQTRPADDDASAPRPTTSDQSVGFPVLR